MGTMVLPSDAYYGIHTARAMANFSISGVPLASYPEFVASLAAVKQAAAQTNYDLGLLDDERTHAIVRACEEIRAGRLHDSFVVDMIQGGAGTSTNMNANEVIANRALELLGRRPGDYARLHPLEHVNLSQSTNDTYPTAIKVALQIQISRLHETLLWLAAAFRAKAHQFAGVVKMGRTQLQDAVAMTLGQEFDTYAVMVTEDAERLVEARMLVSEINLGGTAIGTGLNAPAGYADRVCRKLCVLTGFELSTATDL
ncbi:MAG: aspartate ammonia-lyase, partial [Mycobacterium sp.]|nr:aspartate ammonia-lyase [Mycobacterium sp.]